MEVESMNKIDHGGDILSFIERFGRTPLDFSANTNPLGLSPLAKEAMISALDEADRYPDPYCRALRRAIGEQEDIAPEHILCGNGAADLIYRLVLAYRPRRALLPAPAFSEYENALRLMGCQIEYFALLEENDFQITDDFLPRIRPEIDILFLCEPNNPTGVCTSPELLTQIAVQCRKNSVLLIVDECFNGFLSDPDAQSVKRLISDLPELVILKAFTKMYGMAGVRLGYLMNSDTHLIEAIRASGQHWPVSSLAQAAGVAALHDRAYMDETKRVIAVERQRLRDGLLAAGCRVYPSKANYLFFCSRRHDLQERFAEKGILIRDCSNYEGLEKGYYRIAVRTEQENRLFLDALFAVLP